MKGAFYRTVKDDNSFLLSRRRNRSLFRTIRCGIDRYPTGGDQHTFTF